MIRVLLARRKQRQLPRHHGLDRHPDQLVGDARKRQDRLAELDPLPGVAERRFERAARHADRARRGLDARRLEGRHQLLEAAALDAAEQAVARHREAVERQRVLLHAAVPEHRDLAARQPRHRERLGGAAAGLLGEQDGQTAMARLARIGAAQDGHQVGARGMGDPGLGPGQAIALAITYRAGLQRGEIGAGVGLGEHRRRDHLTRGDARQIAGSSAPRCRPGGSARRRSPSACRASRRRCSRARAPR